MNILAKPEGKNSPQNWKEEGKKKEGGGVYGISLAVPYREEREKRHRWSYSVKAEEAEPAQLASQHRKKKRL